MLSPEQIRERNRNYKHEWRKLHPDKERKARIQDAVRLLEREGYTISAPTTTN